MLTSSKEIADEIVRSLNIKANLLWKNRSKELLPRVLLFAQKHFESGHKTIPDCPQGCECSICLMEDFLL